MITLRKITKDNVNAVIDLSDTLSAAQNELVAPNAISLAQAYGYMDLAWPRAVYLDETPIGFVMLNKECKYHDSETVNGAYLWRMMISADYQRKGYGKEVIRILVEMLRSEGKKYFKVTSMLSEGSPKEFYEKQGFINTGQMQGDELVLFMDL
ncbi:GNAT family N-acetyltransferase [Acidaminobacter sp. JC074]|uniref:GNAT family N-acetyltransferase n=1 Tax=Acidaminobacter sp. JC074 TaxID=2530199 RepID=UPI001F0FD61F|nr:GNAT family N-acetyltransferase [Acidaminobacter sp. JC074]